MVPENYYNVRKRKTKSYVIWIWLILFVIFTMFYLFNKTGYAALVVSFIIILFIWGYFIFRRTTTVKLSKEALIIHQKSGFLLNASTEIKWDEVTEISAEFDKEPKHFLQKDISSLFTKKDKKRIHIPTVKIKAPVRTYGRQLFSKIDIKRDCFRFDDTDLRPSSGTVDIIIERASELKESEKSQEFAERFPKIFRECLENKRKSFFHKDYQSRFSKENRSKLRYQIPLIILFAGLFILAGSGNPYLLLFMEFTLLVFLLIFSTNWFFHYLPFMPRSYLGLELWRAGCIASFMLILILPGAGSAMLLFFALWLVFSFTNLIKERNRKLVTQILILLIVICFIAGFLYLKRVPPGIRVKRDSISSARRADW